VDAVSFASRRLMETAADVLGEDYVIPPEHIDEGGNIFHSAGNVEIFSSDYDWAIWKDGNEAARASVEEQTIELSPEEMRRIYDSQAHEYLLEDAERQLREYAEYHSYVADSEDFFDEFGFTVDEASDQNSDCYLLERFVERYADEFDCNVCENDLWFAAIDSVLKAGKNKAVIGL